MKGAFQPDRDEAPSADASRKERLLTIGQVVAQLNEEFPDLSITKVRYLEDRGLLTPERSPGGYRKYSPSEVRRLRTILTLQRDEYLPLEVIKERVDRPTLTGSPDSVGAGASPMCTTPVLRKEGAIYSWQEAQEATGIDDQFFRTLVEFRLIERAGPSGPVFTDSDLEIARICHLLARFGLEPRNLRLLGSSVEREAALVEQIATPSLMSAHADKREYGEKILEDLGSLIAKLTHLLLYNELRKLL